MVELGFYSGLTLACREAIDKVWVLVFDLISGPFPLPFIGCNHFPSPSCRLEMADQMGLVPTCNGA